MIKSCRGDVGAKQSVDKVSVESSRCWKDVACWEDVGVKQAVDKISVESCCEDVGVKQGVEEVPVESCLLDLSLDSFSVDDDCLRLI